MSNAIVRICTWNFGSCLYREKQNADPQVGKAYAALCLASMSPSSLRGDTLVGLQEVNFPLEGPSQAELLSKDLGFAHFVEWRISDSHLLPGGIGIAVLSAYPIIEVRRHLLPNPRLTNRRGEQSHDKGILAAKVRHPEREFWFLSSHLLPFHRFKKRTSDDAVREILNEVDGLLFSLSDDPTLGAIDFNLELKEADLPNSLGTGRIRRLVHEPTRPEGETHDQLVCSSHWSVRGVRVARTLFDHYLCFADLVYDAPKSQERRRRLQIGPSAQKATILHLSDLHMGSRTGEDVDRKTRLTTSQPKTKGARLESYLRALPSPPDWVVVSGDLTIQGKEDGFEASVALLQRLSDEGKLPPIDRVVVVPGNHDVSRVDLAFCPTVVNERDRWQTFHRIVGKRLVRPWLPTHDPGLDDTRRDLRASIDLKSDYWGGFQRRDPSGGSREGLPFPFVFDRRLGILIYAFNSASASGGQILIGEREREDMRLLRGLKARDARTADGRTVKDAALRIKRILTTFENELWVDPAEIQQPEIELFQATMEYLRRQAGSEVDQALKIAVLHHHLVPLPLEEVKKFELTLNAGGFLRELSNEQFHVVLHGHKHYPELLAAAANANEAPLLIVSCGTIGGMPAPGQPPGFFLLRWDPVARTLAPTFSEVLMSGSPAKLLEKLEPAIEVTVNIGGGFRKSAGNQTFNLHSLLGEAESALCKFANRVPRAKGVGWNHKLDEVRVSMIATAYGLRILHTTGPQTSEGLKLAHEAAATLWALRSSADGGWTATSQNCNDSQPEPTAWALLGLRHWCAMPKLNEASVVLETLMKKRPDGMNGGHTLTLALVARALALLKADSEVLTSLVEDLLHSAFRDENGYLSSWPRFAAPEADHKRGLSASQASVAHTAMAALSLRDVFIATGGRVGCKVSDLTGVRTWLLETQNWGGRN